VHGSLVVYIFERVSRTIGRLGESEGWKSSFACTKVPAVAKVKGNETGSNQAL
jgi:hypothetical protein